MKDWVSSHKNACVGGYTHLHSEKKKNEIKLFSVWFNFLSSQNWDHFSLWRFPLSSNLNFPQNFTSTPVTWVEMCYLIGGQMTWRLSRLLPMFMNFCIDQHSRDLLISSSCLGCGWSVLLLSHTKMVKARNEGACNIVCMKTLFFVFTFLFLVSNTWPADCQNSWVWLSTDELNIFIFS